jgi:hypothetical protein
MAEWYCPTVLWNRCMRDVKVLAAAPTPDSAYGVTWCISSTRSASARVVSPPQVVHRRVSGSATLHGARVVSTDQSACSMRAASR